MLPATPARAVSRALAVVATALLAAAPAAADEPERGNFDARPAENSPAPAGAEQARDRIRERLGRFAALTVDPRTGTLRSVGRLDGSLTGPSERDEAAIALDYVRDHATAFGLDGNDLSGLRLVDRSVADGVEHLTWEQRYRGIPAADAGLKAALTGDGRLVTVTGPPASDLAVRSVDPSVGAREAYAAARASVDAKSSLPTVADADLGGERHTRFADGGRASLSLYRSGSGYRLAWRVLAPVSSTGVYDVLVDARSGAVVRRANRVNFASARVFRYTPNAEAPVGVNLDPWLGSAVSLSGPNAYAFSDVRDVVPFRPGSAAFNLTPEAGSDVAPNPAGNFEFSLHAVPDYSGDGCPGTSASFPTSACTWDRRTASGANGWSVNRQQSATQLFYFVNVFHDHLRDDPGIAFTDKAFERTGKPLGDPNGQRDPTASDPVLAQTLDGAALAGGLPDAEHINNSSFLTLPDGLPGLLQSFLWKPPFGGYDGSNDASLVFHEYTHGLTNRLITDAAGFGALNTAQAGAMGEGWSDFYAMDYLEAASLEQDDAGADLRIGRYLDNADGDGTLVRFQPIDCEPGSPAAQCPAGTGTAGAGGFTYADFGKVGSPGPEVHDDGEIWAQTLWSLRQAVGAAPARRYVTQAMRLSPPEPSFIDMRNALLEASPDADDDLIWRVFASRGMGYFAGSDGADDATPVADFTDPTDLGGPGSISGSVFDQDGPLAGATVGVAGFDNGLGPQHTATTGGDGRYTITGVPTTGTRRYPAVRARKVGYTEDGATNVAVAAGMTTQLDFELVRDWSSSATGAAVRSFTGPDNSDSGCGPGGLIDDRPGIVWGTSRSSGGQEIVVELGAPVDVGTIAIDPGVGCGDDESAALRDYELLGASSPGGAFRSLAGGVFGSGHIGHLNDVFGGSSPSVRYVKLRATTPQDTTAGGSGATYIDVAELHVAKAPGTPVGATADSGGAHDVGPSSATLTGSVVAHGGPVQVIFEYGTTAAYRSAIAAAGTPAGEAPTPVAAAVGGLQPSTPYHFRVVALRDGRRYEGGDATFVTGASVAQSAPPPQRAPKATALLGTRLKASRKGLFKVKVGFGDTAPAGSARLTVSRKGKRLARASTPVRRGNTVTKTLRLSRRGRRVIRPGRTKRVTLELRLPGGQKLKKTVKLTRARR